MGLITVEQKKVLLSFLVGGFPLILIFYLFEYFLWKPKRLRSKLGNQGIRGPSPSFLLGNIPEMKKIQFNVHSSAADSTTLKDDNYHDVVSNISHNWPSTIFPHLVQWLNEYGSNFMYSTGSIQFICVTDIEIVKEICQYTSLNLGKPFYLAKDRGPLLGQGIFSSNGLNWAHQRKIIAPEFYLDKVKGMVSLIVDSATSMLSSWEKKIKSKDETVDMRIDDDFRSLSADIIARACFGSSYSQGEQIFFKLRSLQEVMSKGFIGVPGMRFLPTRNNREIWRLEKEIRSMILKVVKERREAGCEEDLLQIILESANGSGDDIGSLSMYTSPENFIVDNCKSIYFAGHETTAITASWCLMLLAAYPDWQDRARAEALEICRDGIPDADMLRSMKTLTMVIQETLRLYTPAAFVIRTALEDIKLKNIMIPKGMNIQIPIPILHQLPQLWGDDAHEFNPERFQNGILRACKVPQAYLPFGSGPRICLGQHLAMTELKVFLSLVLSKFCFSLSPTYHHSPAFRLLVEPEEGVFVCVKRLK